ncbi:hypothetical protein HDU76_004306, partial [Blyttiomyces sp. JEL0837]
MQHVLSSQRSQPSDGAPEVNDELVGLELQKLQRQFRILAGDRKAYGEESRVLLRKQRSTIEKLNRENKRLAEDLQLIKIKVEYDRKENNKSKVMAERAEALQRKVRTIAMEIATLDKELSTYDSLIDQQRAQMGGVNAAMQNDQALMKQIRVLKNRLDK